MNRQISIFGFCINLKVVAAVGAVALGVFLVAPRFALAVLPFLLVAICPLSCIWMMRGMRGSDKASSTTSAGGTDHLRQLEEEVAQLRKSQPVGTPAGPVGASFEPAAQSPRWGTPTSAEPVVDRPVPS